jgi:catechol 2,3-dioxygenase-like lactoylglutathione lyase family enzyme
MKQDSAVQFETKSRIHVALAVKNLERSIAFYRELFGQGPTKTRPGYAKFEVAEPPVNLSLNETTAATAPSNMVAHFGIQVKSTTEMQARSEQFHAAGLRTLVEEHTTCCYAVQNKVWAADPDGNQWEVFVVVDNDGAQYHTTEEQCCDKSTCCVSAATS